MMQIGMMGVTGVGVGVVGVICTSMPRDRCRCHGFVADSELQLYEPEVSDKTRQRAAIP
jgi:hypothetical protein